MSSDAVAHSAAWPTARPAIAVLVSTYNRASFLGELMASLEAQSLPRHDLEVVLLDNGSSDDTWRVIERIAAATTLPFAGVRLSANRGPGGGRNAGATHVRAPIVAITDDDCLPTSGWLASLLVAFADAATEVVQGRVEPDPGCVGQMGPWDHSIWVTGPTPFFETCNVAYRRSAFERVGGFDEDDPLLHPPSGRAFGEDACLGWAVQRSGGGVAYADAALVYHRCIPWTFARQLTEQRQLRLFPGLARRSPLVDDWFWRRVFFTRTSALFDAALVSLLLTAIARRPVLLLGALPWVRARRRLVRRSPAARAAPAQTMLRYAISDLVALASLVEGSARHRRLVL